MQKKAISLRLGKKGFTLFTALVAVMVIFLGILITQTMISGERGSTEAIKDVEQESEMLDFANFARTDALHQFNFSLRLAFAKYFSKDDFPQDNIPDNYFALNSSAFSFGNPTQNWNGIKTDFTQQYFGDIGNPQCNITESAVFDNSANISNCSARQIVEFASNNIVSSLTLQDSPEGKSYFAQIEPIDQEFFKRILLFVFSRSAKQNDFLKVADCDGDYTGGGCNGGGFYINLDFSPEAGTAPNQTGISDKVYEALPQIQITQSSSCVFENGNPVSCFKTLKQPIFPRSTVRVFVPVRIFKAIAAAKQAITTNDGKTIFDDTSGFKTQLKKIKLGVCDRKAVVFQPGVLIDLDTCYPRKQFDQPEEPRGFSQACIGHEGLPGILLFQPSMINLEHGISYNPNMPNDVTVSASSAIEQHVKEIKLADLLVNFSSAERVAGIANSTDSDFKMLRNGSSIVWGNDVIARDFPSRTIIYNGSPTDFFSRCTKISEVSFNFVFQENNPQYIVEFNQATPGSFKPKFGIRVVDSDFAEYADGSDPTETAASAAQCITTADFSCQMPNPFAGG